MGHVTWWEEYILSLHVGVYRTMINYLIDFSHFFVFLCLHNLNVREKFSNWTFSFEESSIKLPIPIKKLYRIIERNQSLTAFINSVISTPP